MSFFSQTVRSKPSWWEKIHNHDIVAKWREEMVEHDRETVEALWGGERHADPRGMVKMWPRDPLTDAQLKYIFEELEYEASQLDPTTGSFATSIRGVYESRSLINSDLKAQLVRASSIFENVPDEDKDWHPYTDNQVLDLVHPSLYHIRIGCTLVRQLDAKTKEYVLTTLDKDAYRLLRPDLNLLKFNDCAISDVYQWLPTDFAVSSDGQVSPLGYINNVHPSRHRALYPAVSSIVARFVPLWERVLSDVLSPAPPQAIDINAEWYEGPAKDWDGPNSDDDDETNDKHWVEWDRTTRWPTIPEPAPFAPPPTAGRVEFPLRGRTLQVIVKLASIHLTPEKPVYPGGSWHVEGMANERVVATGLYYYAMENVAESRLAFRQRVGDGDFGTKLPYENGDYKGPTVVYGLRNDDALSQALGHLVAEEYKCVAFPNVYQHFVEAFKLEDETRPGHRKILALFLVDPNVRILSTTDVPPQQQEWAVAVAEAEALGGVRKLPQELLDMIFGFTEPALMSRKQAEEHREKLMEERSAFVEYHNEQTFEMHFAMCEH
ncbi:uncharacterized protein BXZ73DRAFT_50116 [Epithele typhae]|uniref:uncharacterized protein n=1 Tax=Epithele typhae TaxID=378194 RepID=UPI00200792A6|nr:uncharacterized protein BXZ73DRAFT_50116 [Epithele typhae]KAH9925048.1 hypothetical protein BXZ73DRAFT_50116 [Epithele typhae]